MGEGWERGGRGVGEGWERGGREEDLPELSFIKVLGLPYSTE